MKKKEKESRKAPINENGKNDVDQLPPDKWLEQFLQKFDLKTVFIFYQLEKQKIKGRLPLPRELHADLNDLDSGSKLKAQNEVIAWLYDIALKDYDLHNPSCSEHIIDQKQQEPLKNSSVTIQCPVCKTLLLLSEHNELIGAKTDDTMKQNIVQQPVIFDIKGWASELKKIYPLIKDEVKQLESDFKEIYYPKIDPSQQAICTKCKYILAEGTTVDHYAKCVASAKFDCITGKTETEHCYVINNEGCCKLYEPKEPEKETV